MCIKISGKAECFMAQEKNDLQEINVAKPIKTKKSTPFFEWLGVPKKRGLGFFEWLEGEKHAKSR